MARKRYWAYALTGGTAGAMDTIDGASLAVGDICEVHNDTTHSTYYLTESGSTESSPHIIAPDANAGDKRWEMAYPTQDAERGFWTDVGDVLAGSFTNTGANIVRLQDRVFIGDACDHDGKRTPTTYSWVGDLGINQTHGWWDTQSRLIVASDFGVAATFASHGNAARGVPGGAVIGINGLGYTDTEDPTLSAYGGYFEAIRGTDGGTCYGLEIDTINLDSTTVNSDYNPYDSVGSVAGTTFGILVASGGGVTAWTETYPCSVAISIAPNSSTFYKGLVFKENGLVRDGTTQRAEAINLPYGYDISWYQYATSPKTPVATITSLVTDAGNEQEIAFSDQGMRYRNGNADTLFMVGETQADIVNYLLITGSETGVPVRIYTVGTDTDVDIRFIPQGAGVLSFGTRTASADAAITGYITIKDASGNTRKLALIN